MYRHCKHEVKTWRWWNIHCPEIWASALRKDIGQTTAWGNTQTRTAGAGPSARDFLPMLEMGTLATSNFFGKLDGTKAW